MRKKFFTNIQCNWFSGTLRHCEASKPLSTLDVDQNFTSHCEKVQPTKQSINGLPRFARNDDKSLAAWLPNCLAAFTLAEVLITLGVIGVVAAITMPTIITKHQQQVTVQRLKKVYSVFSQAYVRSEADNGSIDNWEWPTEDTHENNIEFFNKYFKPYMQVEERPSSDRFVNYAMPDGTTFRMNTGPIRESYYMYVNIDINGDAKPNLTGRDKFSMDIDPYKKRFYMLGWENGLTREDYINGIPINNGQHTACCAKTCATPGYAKHTCGALIQIDGWQIKDDYPW